MNNLKTLVYLTLNTNVACGWSVTYICFYFIFMNNFINDLDLQQGEQRGMLNRTKVTEGGKKVK